MIILSRFFKDKKDEILNAAQMKMILIQSIVFIFLKPIHVQTKFILFKSFNKCIKLFLFVQIL